jgi:hypothetical protein
MTIKIFIDTQFGGSSGLDPISVGMVGEDAQLLYVEATDVTVGPLDVLSKFQRTVGAKFVPTSCVGAEVLGWIGVMAGRHEVELVCSNTAVKKYWEKEMGANPGVVSKVALSRPVDEIHSKIIRLCAGSGNSHALMEALAIAAANKGGGLKACVDATKFGLLIGAKNALSLRAYLRRLLDSRQASAA